MASKNKKTDVTYVVRASSAGAKNAHNAHRDAARIRCDLSPNKKYNWQIEHVRSNQRINESVTHRNDKAFWRVVDSSGWRVANGRKNPRRSEVFICGGKRTT